MKTNITQLQQECRRCPLHNNFSAPINIPIVTSKKPILVVFERPYTSYKYGLTDPRMRVLRKQAKILSNAFYTFLISCYHPFERKVPNPHLEACQYHRKVELMKIKPAVIIPVGESACRTYTGDGLANVRGKIQEHVTGAKVIAVPDPLIEVDTTLDTTLRELVKI